MAATTILASVLIIVFFCIWVDREEGREFFKKHGYTRKTWKWYRKMMNDPKYRENQNQNNNKLNIF